MKSRVLCTSTTVYSTAVYIRVHTCTRACTCIYIRIYVIINTCIYMSYINVVYT
jgi:hypothetical protein